MNYSYYPPKSKYNNHKLYRDGIEWDSKKEYERWLVLKNREKCGEITQLKRQVEWELCSTKRGKDGKVVLRGAKYVADFQYVEDGELVVEDTKGFRTKDYILKRKWMYDKYGILIKEV